MIDSEATLYCDMDGVLADFFSGARALFSYVERGDIPRRWHTSRSIPPALAWIEENLGPSFQLTERSELDIPAVRKLILSAIAFAPGTFFADLPPLPDGTGLLWPFLQRTGHPVALLSAPIGRRRGSKARTAEEGKRDWAARWLPPMPPVHICPSRDKHRFARLGGRSNVLIDDRTRNIQQWRAAGGIGIHHTPGGSEQTVAILAGMLKARS